MTLLLLLVLCFVWAWIVGVAGNALDWPRWSEWVLILCGAIILGVLL